MPVSGSDRFADRLIIALDVETAVEARVLVASLGDAPGFYKVGLEMFAAAGMELVRELKAQAIACASAGPGATLVTPGGRSS